MHCVHSVGSAVKGRDMRSSCDARLVMLGDCIESGVLSQGVQVLSSFSNSNDIVELLLFVTLLLMKSSAVIRVSVF